jgi:single-stranded DNA-binding protein
MPDPQPQALHQPTRHMSRPRAGELDRMADFVIVWCDQAEHTSQSLSRGSRVVLMGRLQQRSWTTEDGSARSVVEVLAEELGRSLRWAPATTTRTMRGPGPAASSGVVVAAALLSAVGAGRGLPAGLELAPGGWGHEQHDDSDADGQEQHRSDQVDRRRPHSDSHCLIQSSSPASAVTPSSEQATTAAHRAHPRRRSNPWAVIASPAAATRTAGRNARRHCCICRSLTPASCTTSVLHQRT